MNSVLKAYRLSLLSEIEKMSEKKKKKEITKVKKILAKGKYLKDDKEILELFLESIDDK